MGFSLKANLCKTTSREEGTDTSDTSNDSNTSDTPSNNAQDTFEREKKEILNNRDKLRQDVRNLDYDKNKLQERIEQDEQTIGKLKKGDKNKALPFASKAKDEVVKCEVGLATAKKALANIEDMVDDVVMMAPLFRSTNPPSPTMAATGKGNQVAAIDGEQGTIEWAEAPADVRIVEHTNKALDQHKAVIKTAVKEALTEHHSPTSETETERVDRMSREQFNNRGWTKIAIILLNEKNIAITKETTKSEAARIRTNVTNMRNQKTKP